MNKTKVYGWVTAILIALVGVSILAHIWVNALTPVDDSIESAWIATDFIAAFTACGFGMAWVES